MDGYGGWGNGTILSSAPVLVVMLWVTAKDRSPVSKVSERGQAVC